MANGHKPGRPIECRAKVIGFALDRRTGVDADPNSNLINVRRPGGAFQCSLHFDRGREGVGRVLERAGYAVPQRLEDRTPIYPDRLFD